MRLFIDESLSPQLAIRLNATGRHDAVHPLHIGRRGQPDHRILDWCIAEGRMIVTQNARDFRRLVGKTEGHPGLVILPSLDRETTWRLLEGAIAFLESKGDPTAVMLNHVLEADAVGAMTLTALQAS